MIKFILDVLTLDGFGLNLWQSLLLMGGLLLVTAIVLTFAFPKNRKNGDSASHLNRIKSYFKKGGDIKRINDNVNNSTECKIDHKG